MNKPLLIGLLTLLPGLTLAQCVPKPKARPATKIATGPYVKYLIDVRLDDKAHVLRGHEELTYTNHSAQALPFSGFTCGPMPTATTTRHLAASSSARATATSCSRSPSSAALSTA